MFNTIDQEQAGAFGPGLLLPGQGRTIFPAILRPGFRLLKPNEPATRLTQEDFEALKWMIRARGIFATLLGLFSHWMARYARKLRNYRKKTRVASKAMKELLEELDTRIKAEKDGPQTIPNQNWHKRAQQPPLPTQLTGHVPAGA